MNSAPPPAAAPPPAVNASTHGSGSIAAWGALLAALGVAAGAFGAHGLSTRIDEAHLRVLETGVRYQLLHAIALVAIGLSGANPTLVRLPASLLAAGVLLFSGSLYALALGGPVWLGPVTPLGGLLLILGWLTMSYRLFARA